MTRIGYMVVTAPPGAPRAVRRALELRREATLRGACPACRALGTLRPQGVVVAHAADCPVSDKMLVRLLGEHGLSVEDLGRELVVVDRGNVSEAIG